MRLEFCCKCDFNVGRKGQPPYTHTRMHEGGRRGWKLTGGRREGRQTGRNNAFVVSSPSDCSKYFTVQHMAEMFVQNPPQLLWEAIILVSQLYRQIPGRCNILADKLSRLQVDEFRVLAPWATASPREVPYHISPTGLGILSTC